MKTLRTLFLFSCAAAAACETPDAPTTERIIRIQIEGCTDVTPVPATPTPTQVAVATAEQTATAAPATPPPVVVAPSTPAPAVDVASTYAVKRESVGAAMAERRLHELDVPDALTALNRSDEFARQKNFDQALRYAEVALQTVRNATVNEAFVNKKFTRVERRVLAVETRLSRPEMDALRKQLGTAQNEFLANRLKRANEILYAIEQKVDLAAKASARAPR